MQPIFTFIVAATSGGCITVEKEEMKLKSSQPRTFTQENGKTTMMFPKPNRVVLLPKTDQTATVSQCVFNAM